MVSIFGLDLDQPICSRKGCDAEPQWCLVWNNPKIHAPERKKIWLSCENHRQWLENFLKQRQFWKETVLFEGKALDV